MNFVKSLVGGLIGQTPSATELAKLPNGQLYLVRPGNIRSSRECIFNEAMITVRRAPVEHHFELVITRVFESGDQELLEDDEETDDERSFLIGRELEFRPSTTTDGEPNYKWRDLQGDIDEMFEFVPDDADESARALFEVWVYRAMYEHERKQSSDNATDAELEEFIWKPASSKAQPTRKKATLAAISPDLDLNMPTPLSSQDVLVLATAELHRWLPEQFTFSNEGVAQARILKRKVPTTPFEFWLTVTHEDEDTPVLAHRITDQMNQRLSFNLQTLTWNHLGTDGSRRSWLLRFAGNEPFEEVHQTLSRSLWETLHQTSFAKLKTVEQTYVFTSDQDVEMKDVQDNSEEEDEVMDELNKGDDDDEESEEEEGQRGERRDDDEDNAKEFLGSTKDGKRERNSRMAVGYRGDRMFIARGDKIGIFKPGEEDGPAEFSGSVTVKTLNDKIFRPEEFMLHEKDTKMIIMNPNDHSALYSMDIEVGKMVEEWKIHDDVQVDHIAPINKFAPTTGVQTIVGASHNGIFMIDPRLSDTKLVESQFKQYVSKNKFSGVATTSSGQVAVASEKGDIRLFDSIGKNAKTALPPLGDPIIGIDTTADGRWVVATTKTYLLLIDTLIGDGRYAGSLGFDRSFPADARPEPRRLRLKPEHAQYTGEVSFSPAKFNQGEGIKEKTIVTSTGEYVVAWDFTKVKKGQVETYQIQKYGQNVAQDNFMFGDDKQIVVALDYDVLNVNKKSLRPPNRTSLGGPSARKSIKSRSSIVNSPY